MFTRRFTVLATIIVLILSIVTSYTVFSAQGEARLVKPTATEEVDEEVDMSGPKTEACPLNGKLYTESARKAWEQRRPLGVMVENSLDARPQSGLSNADVVYELVAEGGITRFLLMYYCDSSDYIGPVRSARIYFVRLLQGYGEFPLYAHVGGAATPGPANSLGEIVQLGWENYNDLTQFSVPFPIYWRDYERKPGVATEHTMYTNADKLWEFAAKERGLGFEDEKGTPWNETFEPWMFADDAGEGSRGDVGVISYGFWDESVADYISDYGVTWTYDVIENAYLRDNGGEPHIDRNTGEQLFAKNVVVVFATEADANDGYPGGHLLYGVVDSGDALVYQNGEEIEAFWSKPTADDRMVFTDVSGKEIEMVRGETWISVLPIGNKVETGAVGGDLQEDDETEASE